MIVSKGNRSNFRVSSDKIKMTLDIRTLDIFCRYIMSTSAYLRISNIINMGKLIRNLDPDTYINDIEKTKRIKFILKALEARIDCKLTDINMVWMHIRNNIDVDLDFIDDEIEELDKNSVLWVNQMVAESLQYFFIYNESDSLLDLCTRIRNSDYNNRGALISEFESKLDDLKNYFRKTKIENNSITDMTFSLRSGIFEQAVTDTWNLITSPSRRLITGMQGLNEMLGGGFENGRVYILMGITGVGKSVTLLNIAKQIKKFNKNYKTKDPTKQPCIVILTMENSVVETITRLFDMSVDDSIGMANYSLNEVIRKLREEGEMKLTDESPIDIVVKYKPNRSVDTSYLYSLCADLEDDGYEVIALIQDHLKRIRSTENISDLRIELGEVTNEFKSFATDKDIPVITNTHFNRDAVKMVEDSINSRNQTVDITKKLGKGNTGESMLIQDNTDVAISINIDYDVDGNKYMGFYLSKMRDKTNRTYIAQPFVYGSGIKLLEDVGGVPMFKESLHQNTNINRMASIRSSSTSTLSNISVKHEKNAFDQFTDSSLYQLPVIDNEEDEDIPVIITQPEIVEPLFFADKNGKPSIYELEDLKSQLEKHKVG